MENDKEHRLYPSLDEIIIALQYCTRGDGKMCEYCPFAGYGRPCAHILYVNTVRLLYAKEEE